MKKLSDSKDPLRMRGLWRFFVSVKLTVVILLCLAATSIIGTIIPQNESPAEYARQFGSTLHNIFDMLGIYDMYHAWWFQFLLILLFVNITACSVDRLSASWKIIFRTPLRIRPPGKKKDGDIVFSDKRPLKVLADIFPSIIAGRFGRYVIENNPEGFSLAAEKNRWSRLGVYIVHFGVILLLVGGLVGSMFGFSGFAAIPEGEAVDHVRLNNGAGVIPLGFVIQCDDFDVQFYDTGVPREFRSRLTILEAGVPLFTRDVIVNKPLRFRGINIFQNSYGNMPPREIPAADLASKELALNITNRQTGMAYSKTASVGDTVALPEGRGTLTLHKFLTRAEFGGRNIHEVLACVMTLPDGTEKEVLLPIRFPDFDKMRGGHFIFSLENTDALMVDDHDSPQYYTGLQITRDPGVPLVYTGFSLLLLGCYMSFFMSHRQVAVHVRQTGNNCRVTVTGSANKNRFQMKQSLDRLAKALSDGKLS